MGRYGKQTEVSEERSRAEIERTIRRYGATRIMVFTDQDSATIAFQIHGYQVRFDLKYPDPEDYSHTATGKLRAPAAFEKAITQARRQRWRSLLLRIKGKLEAIDDEFATFEEEFLAYIVFEGSRTVGSEIIPSILNGQTPILALEDTP